MCICGVFCHYLLEKKFGSWSAVSFQVGSGQSLALVGATGSGKSTVVRLLYRLYDPETGFIKLNGQDLRSLTQKSLRAEMGMVPQDVVLFNDTIEYNIRYSQFSANSPHLIKEIELPKMIELRMEYVCSEAILILSVLSQQPRH